MLTMRPNPGEYMCGSAARINRNGASTISASIDAEAFRAEIGDRVDALDAGVVDQDIRLQSQVLERADIEKIDRPSGSADLVGQRLRPRRRRRRQS